MPQRVEVVASRTLSITIARPPEIVARFVWDAANLPMWAKAFCQKVE